MTPFDSLHTVSYYRPIVTLCLKCTVLEIWRHIGRKSLKNLPHCHLARSLGVTRCEIFDESDLARKWTDGAIRRCAFHNPFALLDIIPAVTDRRMDGHVAVAKTALCIASRG